MDYEWEYGSAIFQAQGLDVEIAAKKEVKEKAAEKHVREIAAYDKEIYQLVTKHNQLHVKSEWLYKIMTKYKNTSGKYFSPKKVALPAKDGMGDADKQKAITALQFNSPKKASPMKTSPLKSNGGSEGAGCMIPSDCKFDAVAGASTSYGDLSLMKECAMEASTSTSGASGS